MFCQGSEGMQHMCVHAAAGLWLNHRCLMPGGLVLHHRFRFHRQGLLCQDKHLVIMAGDRVEDKQ